MYILPASRRPHVFIAALSIVALVLFLHNTQQTGLSSWSSPLFGSHPTTSSLENVGLEAEDHVVRGRVSRMKTFCEKENPFEKEYGRTNIRLTRAYEGSHYRLQQFIHKALRGEALTISAIGGSITGGHQVQRDEIWFHKFREWLNTFFGNDVDITEVNGAAPATGSDYFSFCFSHHIPSESDLVLVELAVNDEGILEHIENMENLLRGLLDLPNKPAVILVEALAFSNGGMGGGGGRMHLPVAQYFDVPVINQRHPLANHFGRYPQLIGPYFSRDWWGNSDMRHINARGHRDLGMLVASLIQDAACTMLSENDFFVPHPSTEASGLSILGDVGDEKTLSSDQARIQDQHLAEIQSSWAEQSRSWRERPSEGDQVGKLMPGMWVTPAEYGMLPRMRVLDGWNPDTSSIVPPFQPTCLSTRAKQAQFNLTPSYNEGWEYWIHPEHTDKPYLVAKEPGATVSFELDTNVGVVKMYALKSKTFGLGDIECWADDEKHKSTKVTGWWDNGDVNIGRFATIRTDLARGKHIITCKVLEATSNPDGGHEFRMISMMR
ncbi:uncharacterized protein IL334_006338 [Kwoniella shivajii]|uniref:Capsular associated protein n=1 Tax=Kwoniella shivajii TaxID=564305 RepID=A0ABZ1D5N5_9TREE|nr:hypothetical protein IL334_006338 [Kwoniella shivajii]